MATTTKNPAATPAASQATDAVTTAAPLKSAAGRTAQSKQHVAKPTTEKPVKVKKSKLVRDRFTLPKTEYTVLDELKQRADKLAHTVKKSELLRAGVKALAAMPDRAFLSALNAVPAIETGKTKTKK